MKTARDLVRTPLAAAVALLLPLAGCGEGGEDPIGPGGDGAGSAAVSLSVTSGQAASAVRTPAFALEQSDDAGNSLVIDSVQVVLREIELERQNDECPDDSGSGDDNDACEEFTAGIQLLQVPLDGSVQQMVAIQAPADTYDEVEFEIHKPDDDEPEGREFIQENPNFEDVSVRVKGTYNGEPFLFLQDLNEDQERVLNPPLVLEEAGEVNLTLRLDVATWFVRDDGTLIDPVTANKGGANEDLVEENIENSIEVFEDDDEDGEDDD